MELSKEQIMSGLTNKPLINQVFEEELRSKEKSDSARLLVIQLLEAGADSGAIPIVVDGVEYQVTVSRKEEFKPPLDPSTCVHVNFGVRADIGRLKDNDNQPDDAPVKNYVAEITVVCTDCLKPFRFIGLPCGVDLEGAAVSVDGREARLRILPYDQVLTPLEGLTGFTVRKTK